MFKIIVVLAVFRIAVTRAQGFNSFPLSPTYPPAPPYMPLFGTYPPTLPSSTGVPGIPSVPSYPTYPPYDPPHPGMCYIRDIGTHISRGAIVQHPTRCEEYRCGHNLVLTQAGCGTNNYDPSRCMLADGDMSQSFPNCCPKMWCYPDRPWYM